jgi:hypothetical protein
MKPDDVKQLKELERENQGSAPGLVDIMTCP